MPIFGSSVFGQAYIVENNRENVWSLFRKLFRKIWETTNIYVDKSVEIVDIFRGCWKFLILFLYPVHGKENPKRNP